jgi:hypothetical protein
MDRMRVCREAIVAALASLGDASGFDTFERALITGCWWETRRPPDNTHERPIAGCGVTHAASHPRRESLALSPVTH